MSLVPAVKLYVHADRFLVRVPGLRSFEFCDVDAIDTHAARITPRTCTIKRALDERDDDLAKWAKLRDQRTIEVAAISREGEVVKVYRIVDATPVHYSVGPWSARESEVLLEGLTFEYDASKATEESVNP